MHMKKWYNGINGNHKLECIANGGRNCISYNLSLSWNSSYVAECSFTLMWHIMKIDILLQMHKQYYLLHEHLEQGQLLIWSVEWTVVDQRNCWLSVRTWGWMYTTAAGPRKQESDVVRICYRTLYQHKMWGPSLHCIYTIVFHWLCIQKHEWRTAMSCEQPCSQNPPSAYTDNCVHKPSFHQSCSVLYIKSRRPQD